MARVALLARHWPLLAVLVAGLLLRLPHAGGGHHGDILNYSRVATWLVSPGSHLDLYRNGYVHAYPFAHPPLGIVAFAPFNALALATGSSYVHAFHYLMYSFEAVTAVVLYRLALTASPRVALAALVAGYWFIGLLTPLWLPWGTTELDTSYTSMSTALLVAALLLRASPRATGICFGLALATRTDVALLAVPWALHYHARSWTALLRFAGTAALICALIVAPFALRDLAAFDWALRGHVAGRLSDELPLLWRWLEPLGLSWLAAPIQPFNSAVMALAVLGVSVVGRRDPRLERLLLLVGLTHVLTMPVLHPRYVQYVLALGLAYVALNGAYAALAGWSALRLAVGLSVFSAGPAWGTLLWRSVRAAPMERDAFDPAPAYVRDWLERAPHWAAPVAVTVAVCAAGLARVSAEPRVEDGAARLLALVLLTPPFHGPGALLSLLSDAVRALPLGTLAWRLNAAPVVPVALAAFGAGVCAARLWPAVRWRALAHGAGALGTAGVALGAGAALGVWNPAPEREAYRSLTVLNLEMLDRDALLCVRPRNAGLWAYAHQIEGVRPDVQLRHGSADECAVLAAQEFSRRPVYVDALPGEMQRSELVYFPARGVWRAVSKRASFADGAVIKGPDERIFLIEGGARRWIPSLDTFTALGLRWEHVQLASFDELAALPQGPPLG